ncbi:MAG: uL15 family ribosomal protein [Candidatus Bathyarchaeota archaeon]|nr:uL15 family ribosomal protein [Candidatus Bathyarchaeota archaeon]
MPHKDRKVRKQRGSRTHGYGQIGQHRAGGGRGGHGKAGLDKHKWTYIIKHDPEYFKKKGFVSTRTLGRKVNVINVGKLDDLADKLESEKKLERKEKKIFLDLESLGYDKLLGTGEIIKPMLVKVASYSEAASRKLEEAGGQILKEKE